MLRSVPPPPPPPPPNSHRSRLPDGGTLTAHPLAKFKKKGKEKVEGGKKGEGKGKEKQISEGDDWELCRGCNTSFSQDEENGNECKWIQCDASHIDCNHADLLRMLFTFDTNNEDEYLCPTCWYMESA